MRPRVPRYCLFWVTALTLVISGIGTSLLWGQAPPASIATIQIEYTNPGLTPSHWKMTIHADGSGQFEARGAASPSIDGGQTETRQIQAGDVQRPIQLSQGFTDQVFAVARDRKFFAFPCESHMKVAFQGTKRMSYSGPEGTGAGEFNYSKDKEIQSVGNSLIAVEDTLLSGARMEKLLQHDRLGLDAELDSLTAALRNGDALEIGTIRDILTRIATDEEILERARRKARLLLTQGR